MGKILDIQKKKAFKKIKFSFTKYRDRLWRTMYVASDIDLFKLGIAIGASLGCSFQHVFSFTANKLVYSSDTESETDLPVDEHYLSELGSNFIFHYDPDDDWKFECRVSKKEEEFDEETTAFVTEGAGQGIWEDNRWTLEGYLSGDIKPSCRKENEKMGYFFPWNFEIEKFGDFDNPIDIEEMNEEIDLCISTEGSCYRAISELDGDLSELDDEAFGELTEEFLDQAFTLHALSVPYISKKLAETKGRYGREELLEQLYERFCEEIATVIMQNKPYSSQKYREDIEKI